MASSSFNFTKEAIDKIIPPEFTKDHKGKIIRPEIVQHVYRDTKEKGLVLNVSYLGTKSFFLAKTIKGIRYKIMLGSFPDMSVIAARSKIIDLKNQIAKGIDLNAKSTNKQYNELTFKELFDIYIEDYAKHKIERWKDVIADIDRQAKHLYDRKISTIQKDDIQKIFNDLTKAGKKVMANKCATRFSGIFKRGIEWGLVKDNPALGIIKHQEKSRDRYLLSKEEQHFFDVLAEEPNQTIRDFVLVALYTAARKSNVLAMRWDNINLTEKTWYIPKTKNGESHLLPLTDKAVQILQERYKQRSSKWVFPSDHNSKSGHIEDPKKTWCNIKKKAGLEDFTLHDLRRTMGSWMAIAGASPYVIAKALNHKNIRSTEVYARLNLDPVREYMEKANSVFNNNKKKA